MLPGTEESARQAARIENSVKQLVVPRSPEELEDITRRLQSETIIGVSRLGKLLWRHRNSARRLLETGKIEAFVEEGRWRTSLEAVERYRKAALRGIKFRPGNADAGCDPWE